MNTKNGSHVDKATGAFVPDLFSHLVGWEIRRSLRYQNFATLLVVEPDRRLRSPGSLEALVGLIKKNIRETDVVGRLANSKFAVLLLYADLDGAYITGSRILEHINNYVFSEEKTPQVTASIGGACFPTNSTSIDGGELFTKAEEAFQKARKRGNTIILPGLPVFTNPTEKSGGKVQ